MEKHRPFPWRYFFIWVCFIVSAIVGVASSNVVIFLLSLLSINLGHRLGQTIEDAASNRFHTFLSNWQEYTALQAYKKATATYEAELEQERRAQEKIARAKKRQQIDYWTSLDPWVFENETAELFRRVGYEAKVTKGSGDGGIDIVLFKDGKCHVVQCKRYKTKVGPSVCRELFGVIKAGGFRSGFIVCPSGFSEKAWEFSRRKPITLVGAKRMLEMLDGKDPAENNTDSSLPSTETVQRKKLPDGFDPPIPPAVLESTDKK